MIIVNQNKDEFVNFDNVINVSITYCEEDGYLISAGFIVGRDDNYRELGYYKTKNRAKEVLKEITRFYKMFKGLECCNSNVQCELAKEIDKYGQGLYVYEMPLE